MLTPADPELEVTLASVVGTESKTPSKESAKYRTATATKSMTQATNEIRKLNFITDHGASLATTRSARRPRLPRPRHPSWPWAARPRRIRPPGDWYRRRPRRSQPYP